MLMSTLRPSKNGRVYILIYAIQMRFELHYIVAMNSVHICDANRLNW